MEIVSTVAHTLCESGHLALNTISAESEPERRIVQGGPGTP